MSIYDKSSLVLIPSGTKTGKVFSQKPVSGDGDFTFTRASAATRVNADGNIEKERGNVLLQSNSFSTTWIDVSTNKTSGQSGYDGSNDAWLLSKTNSSARLYQNITYSGVNTFSVYVKAGTLNWVMLNNGTNSVWYDLQNGVVGTNSAGGGSLDASIESVGSGWYRVILVSSVSASLIRIYPAKGDNDVSGTSGNIYIQDAQLEQGLVARDVITTTTAAVYGGITDNTPRLDYTDSSCPALLLEPQRTNLVTQSEYLSSWTQNNISVTDNDSISPEGLQNASALVGNGSSSYHWIQRDSGSGTSGTTYTASFFAKKGSVNFVQLVLDSSVFGIMHQNFDLENGTIGSGSGSTTPFIEDYGNGWYRVGVTATATATATIKPLIALANSSAMGRFGSFATSGNIKVFGVQVEAGSYATSYIPTYGSSVSRVREAIDSVDLQANGVTNNATGWTYIVKGTFNGNGAAGNNILVQRDEGGFFYRYGSSFGFSGATKGYWTEFNPNGGFAYIWDGTQLRVRRGGSDIRTISAADIGWSAGGTSNWTINYLNITRISFELENAFIFNQALTNEEIDSLV
jgi:hypothetical protein